jgi:hypothetical protein
LDFQIEGAQPVIITNRELTPAPDIQITKLIR